MKHGSAPERDACQAGKAIGHAAPSEPAWMTAIHQTLPGDCGQLISHIGNERTALHRQSGGGARS
ncbi:hypothetical protein ACF06W_06605 [Streptomyces albus]|uniref:hypothetical protein n=1 Tax=Streptomyces albus TaxID=1888 RepID=UPI0036FEC08C